MDMYTCKRIAFKTINGLVIPKCSGGRAMIVHADNKKYNRKDKRWKEIESAD